MPWRMVARWSGGQPSAADTAASVWGLRRRGWLLRWSSRRVVREIRARAATSSCVMRKLVIRLDIARATAGLSSVKSASWRLIHRSLALRAARAVKRGRSRGGRLSAGGLEELVEGVACLHLRAPGPARGSPSAAARGCSRWQGGAPWPGKAGSGTRAPGLAAATAEGGRRARGGLGCGGGLRAVQPRGGSGRGALGLRAGAWLPPCALQAAGRVLLGGRIRAAVTKHRAATGGARWAGALDLHWRCPLARGPPPAPGRRALLPYLSR